LSEDHASLDWPTSSRLMAWCGGLRADHGQKHEPGGEMITRGLDTQQPITEGPEVFPHRIGIDSGCFHTGVLTAVELANDWLRFHGVASMGDLWAFRDGLNPDQARAFTMPEPLKT
jgi:hypothetical protein